MDKKLEILVVEDDLKECENIKRELDNNPDDFTLIGITNNSSDAFEVVIANRPDAVILDLELHKGGGDGLDFLKRLKEKQLENPPFILITTKNVSLIIHKIARDLGADFIITKDQNGYEAKYAIDFLKLTKSVILSRKKINLPETYEISPTQTEKRLTRRICQELDAIGISAKSKGYTYLIDAITITFSEPTQHLSEKIGLKYKKSAASVERAMQNAISRAWTTSDIDNLLANYTAKIKSDRGVPTVTEFIFYYAQKIKNDL